MADVVFDLNVRLEDDDDGNAGFAFDDPEDNGGDVAFELNDPPLEHDNGTVLVLLISICYRAISSSQSYFTCHRI